MDAHFPPEHFPLVFRDLLVAEVKRRLLGESIPRLKQCLEALDEAEIWERPNAHSNSAGHLTLHLCGNARQWILSGLAKAPDRRDRDAEFTAAPIARQALLEQLDELAQALSGALDAVRPQDIFAQHEVQVFRESGLSILVHVVEHFSYHVGQVTYIVKAKKNMDMGYYRGIDLNRK
jgi:uncharacterized damage-inducible protein DinB